MNEREDTTAGDVSTGTRRPIYYGGFNKRAIYYGGHAPSAYPGYPGGGYGGGAYYYGMGGGVGDDTDSLMGTVTIGRMLRVCSQRWVTLVVFVIIGFIAAFAVFKISPMIYEAESVFEMSIRGSTYTGMRKAIIETDVGSSLDEVFNTRLARLRSRAVIDQIVSQYRSDYPSSTVTDEQLIETLFESKMTLQRRSRLIRVTVRSTDPQLATDLANAYAKAAETFTSDSNRNESEVAVSWLATTTEQQKRNLERADKEMLDFRVANQLDFMASESETTQQARGKINADILVLEGEITKATELRKTLEQIQNEPEKFGTLPEAVPRSGEIGTAYQQLQNVLAEKNSLLARYTANHPEVKVKEKEAEVFKQQFADVVFRALETCKANLDLLQRQLAQLTPKRDELVKKLSDLELKMVETKMKLEQLEREREVADISYKSLLQRTREAQVASDENTAIIKQVEAAYRPTKPVLPNPMIIFPAGPLIGLLLGVVFVLVLDHLEDTIVGISDIEQRLRLKTLAVLPHVRRKKREQLARLVADDKFSQFAEAVAGLRNLLDSPRYQEMTKVLLCMSTQPGEGKTIASCSLALSYAQSGQKTLLIDFDMRRPRLARIFEKRHSDFNSLPHTLAKGDTSLFETLPVASGMENLDVVLSRASSELSPSSLMGSGVIVDFFSWAREHYDHVIIDSPPFGIVGDVMVLASLVDAVMILCCPDRTRFQPIKHAARHLTEAGARVIGVIVNDVDFGRRNHFSHYDYHYRYAYRYTSRYGAYGQGKKPGDRTRAAAAGGAGTVRLDEDDLIPSGLAARRDVVDVSMTDDE
ncbi:MAG TPA: polysaccharide biosynthesis tyrosine autokinase [Kiritimatiellia bacterium]|nr:polysaccharide biosynthesis tyrosine autokinase [Kiritimatiellia bacterium]HPK37304.1 polysaccharide biosynthesis tyrosine autokinase [Kiritimatiellia bacterium]